MQKSSLLKIDLLTNEEAQTLFGHEDVFLNIIEEQMDVSLLARGNEITIQGEEQNVRSTQKVIHNLIDLYRTKKQLLVTDVNYYIEDEKNGVENSAEKLKKIVYTTPTKKNIRARTLGQKNYIETIENNDIVFGIGPAGTGKTFLAVVMAIRDLKRKKIERIILVRPAVEAGESLGFLPGDLKEKIDPYLRPLYDALNFILGPETSDKLIERNVIEIAPLAYMRGRTLENAFIILDEAQNTTEEQMKMFLTRIGFNSKAVVTGDLTQVDLPRGKKSGLQQCQRIMKNIPGIEFYSLTETDVVRHPLVKRIIQAYEQDKLTTS
ncbi:PhoH family protein [Clostridia bacterium]|nr:PhoH family protein [Clostridia bacterium]